jgi:hypothetical protein
MSRITNISDGNNIEISIYFKPIRIYDEDETDTIEFINDIQGDLITNFRVIQNNDDITQFIGEDGIMNKLTSYIETGDMCNGLFPTYITRCMLNSHAIIVIKSSLSEEIYGFAIIKFFEKDMGYIYVDIICSKNGVKGGGHVLMTTLIKICKILSFKQIKLHSVKSAIDFYKKYGFVKDEHGCTKISEDKGDCLMIKLFLRNTEGVIEYGIGGTNKRRTNKRRKPRKSRSNKRYNKRLTNKRNTKRIK